jgi:UDP-2,4-diacetamido-2,4,6-trideoxy-beta-L-altropyranose hydrolase
MTNQIKINKATINDMLDIFELANDEVVRRNSFNQEKININDHKEWFIKKINDPNCLFLIFKNHEEQFIGSVRFDLDKNYLPNNYIISIQISKNFRGKNIANPILKQSIEEFHKVFKDSIIIAKIKNDNIASIKIFKKNNFIVISENKQENYVSLQLINN